MNVRAILMIAVVAGVTQVTRWIPFWLFGGRALPQWVARLGRALPPAIMAALVVYCLKDVPFGPMNEAACALIAAGAVALLQWKMKNTLLSIAAGTALYMALIRVL